VTLSFVIALLGALLSQAAAGSPASGSAPAAPAKSLRLAQLWKLDARFTDAAHGVSFRYPLSWQAGTQFGSVPPALTLAQEKSVSGFMYENRGFQPGHAIPPYSTTNLQSFGIVFSAIPAENAAACEAKASAAAAAVTDVVGKPHPVVLGGRTFSVRELSARAMH
jgi:hypothetical protein